MPATGLLLFIAAIFFLVNASNFQQVLQGKLKVSFQGKPTQGGHEKP